MPTPTYIPLASLTLTGSASTVTFSSISGAYRDLVLVVSATNSTANVGLRARFNGDTGSNYNSVIMSGNGTTTTSSSATYTEIQGGLNYLERGITTFNVMDYSATDKHKATLIRADLSSSLTAAYANRWASTAVITTIAVYPSANQFAAGSTFALFGIAS